MNELLETEIGTIASDWNVLPLEEICEPPQYGFTASAEEQGNAQLLRITDIADSGVKWSTVPFCACPPELLNRYRLATGDIVFARIGATTGKSYLITSPPLSVFASYLIRVRTRRDIDPAFLSLFFRSNGYWRQVDAQKNANLKKGVSGSLLKVLLVPVPPLPEQLKIAGVLGRILRAIEQQERLLQLTAELKNALLRQLFTQGLRGEHQKQTEIGPVPEGWNVVRLQEVCTFLSGGTPSKQKPDFWEGDIPWVSPKDMKRPRLNDAPDHISKAALQDGSVLAPAGSIFVVVRGMILAKDIPVALAEIPMAFNQDMKAIIPGPKITSAFLLYAMGAFKQKLFEKVGRSAHGTMTLMSSEIANFAIPLPDMATQEAIAAAIETAERKHHHHRRRHAALTDLFRTVLHQLMTAQIRVHDLELPDLEAAAAV